MLHAACFPPAPAPCLCCYPCAASSCIHADLQPFQLHCISTRGAPLESTAAAAMHPSPHLMSHAMHSTHMPCTPHNTCMHLTLPHMHLHYSLQLSVPCVHACVSIHACGCMHAVLLSTVWSHLTSDVLAGVDVSEVHVAGQLKEACEREVRRLHACTCTCNHSTTSTASVCSAAARCMQAAWGACGTGTP